MRRLLLGLSVVCASALQGQPPATTHLDAVAGTSEIDKSTQTEDVRFRTDLSDRMTVPVRLSGTGPYRFLVDTGADRTAISRQLAARLGLSPGQKAELHSIASASTVDTAMVPSLQLTRKSFRIADAPLLESVNMGADGILGVDSLRSQRVELDFQTQTMSVVPAVEPDFKVEPGTIIVQAHRRNGRLLLTEATADGQPLSVVIDTGSQVSVGNEALRRQLLGSRFLKGSEEVVLESVTGEKITGDYMFVKELDIGGFGLKNLAIVFTDAHTFKQLKLDKRPALLLGMNAMRAFKKVSIDFASKRLRVVVPESSAIETRVAFVGE
jgi:predicted aspartyl protease